MKTTVQCTGCKRTFIVSQSIIGRLLRCKHCGVQFRAFDLGAIESAQSMILPEGELDDEPPAFDFQEPEPSPQPQSEWVVYRILVGIGSFTVNLLVGIWRAIVFHWHLFGEEWHVWTGCLAGACFITFLVSRGWPPSPLVLVSYVSLFSAVWLTLFLAQTKLPKHWAFQKSRAVVAIAVVLAWGPFDWYYDEFTNKAGSRVTDTRYRWSGQAIYRDIYDPNADGSYKGPLAGTPPKPHGHWQLFWFKPKYESIDEWYWYGDKVTQGEWELRRRK